MTDTTYADKKLAPGEARFRLITRMMGRRLRYEIYDRVTGSIPAVRYGVGRIKQNMADKEEAEAEMERVEEFYRGK